MEGTPETIGERKFRRLSAPQQHKLLALLALRWLAEAERDVDDFRARYRQMVAWAGVDAYRPPAWLSPAETLWELVHFHAAQAGRTPDELAASAGVGTAEPAQPRWQGRVPLLVALDRVFNAHNLGAVLRLVDNFGLEGVVHATAGVRLDHPKLVRAARGCERWIPVHYQPDLPAYLRALGRPIIALELAPEAIPLDRWQPHLPAVVLVGNEAFGLSQAVAALASERVYIPVHGYKHSMNLAAALAVFAYRAAGSPEIDVAAASDCELHCRVRELRRDVDQVLAVLPEVETLRQRVTVLEQKLGA